MLFTVEPVSSTERLTSNLYFIPFMRRLDLRYLIVALTPVIRVETGNIMIVRVARTCLFGVVRLLMKYCSRRLYSVV